MPQRQLFLSHRTEQKPVMRRLAAALQEHDIVAWIDEREIDPFAPITDAVRQGIWESHGFLAWWVGDYGESEPCHYELLTATACCLELGLEAVGRRLFLAGDQAALAIGAAGPLRHALAQRVEAATDEDLRQLAAAIAARLPRDGTLGALAPRPQGLPVTIAPSRDFVGRARELWSLHANLWGGAPGTEGGSVPTVVVSGIGGQGKSVLTEEYARRFAAWYAGGVHRMALKGDESGDDAAISVQITSALGQMAERLNVPVKPNATPADLRMALARAPDLAGPGARYLWLVDDVPSAATDAQVSALLAPTVSVRSRHL